LCRQIDGTFDRFCRIGKRLFEQKYVIHQFRVLFALVGG
jgi:hypothetical protein